MSSRSKRRSAKKSAPKPADDLFSTPTRRPQTAEAPRIFRYPSLTGFSNGIPATSRTPARSPVRDRLQNEFVPQLPRGGASFSPAAEEGRSPWGPLSPLRRLTFEEDRLIADLAQEVTAERAPEAASFVETVLDAVFGLADFMTQRVKRATAGIKSNPLYEILKGHKDLVRELDLNQAAVLLQIQLGQYGIVADFDTCKELMSIINIYGSGKVLLILKDVLRRLKGLSDGSGRAGAVARTGRSKKLMDLISAILDLFTASKLLLKFAGLA